MGILNIRVNQDDDFIYSFNHLKEKYGADFQYLNGFHDSQLDFSQFIAGFVDKNTVADTTIDGNANAKHKDICSLNGEKGKSEDKVFAFNKIFYELKKKYGLRTAREWLEAEWTGAFYMHDAPSATYKPYCLSGDTKIITKEGLFRLDELVDKKIKVINKNHEWEDATVKYFGKQTMRYLTLERDNYIFTFKTTGNHLWFCINSDTKELELVSTDNLKPKMIIPYNDLNNTLYEKNWEVVSIVDSETEMDCYCAVVPGSESFTLENNVLTHNCYAYDLSRLAREGLFFLDDYNNVAPQHLTTFIDDVIEFISFFSNRSSGACGLPNILVWAMYFWKKDIDDGYYLRNPDYYLKQSFQKFIFRVNQPFLRVDQSAFVNVSIFDRYYYESLFGGLVFPDGSFAIDYVDEFIRQQKIFMEVVSETRQMNMFTFPVLTYSLLKRDDITKEDMLDMIKTKDYQIFKDNDFARWCSDHNCKWYDSNFFMSSDVTTLSNCCRLLSDTSKLSGFINSIGGTALSIGSVKVSTINLMRIALESGKDEEEYLKILRERALLDCKVLDRQRWIIKRNIDKGLLPNYCDGGIELDKQYSTLGVLGVRECIGYFGYIQEDEFGNISYTEDGIRFAKDIFRVLNEVKDTFCSIYGDKVYYPDRKNVLDDFSFNIESVPAERAAVILCQKDNLLYELDTDKYIYSNQWIALSEQATIDEKLKLSSILDKECSGGQILHANLESSFPNTDVAWDMLNKIAISDVIYFAFNAIINECEDHHVFIGTDHCPVCGKPVMDTWSRIVGLR